MGLSIALTISAIGLLLAAIRLLAKKGDATIRVELADPTAAYRMLRASPAPTPDSVDDRCENPERRTCVRDLSDVPLPIPALGPTFEERRRKEEERRKRQEEEILQQVFEDNLNLLEASAALRQRQCG